MKIVESINLTNEIVDEFESFRVGYCAEIDEHLLCISVPWIAWYERYYKITNEDYELYKSEREAFVKKYSLELSQDGISCFTQNFIGADALRDYDGKDGFQTEYATDDVNPYQYHIYENGILYARIVWGENEVYVPPIQVIQTEEGLEFPLRESCSLVMDSGENPLCWILDTDNE